MAPVCTNCGSTDFVWAGELKTGGKISPGNLSLRGGGELPLGTRICRACGHADLFLRDVTILKAPHHWRPGEFVPIAAPAPSRAPTAPPPAAAPPRPSVVTAAPSPPASTPYPPTTIPPPTAPTPPSPPSPSAPPTPPSPPAPPMEPQVPDPVPASPTLEEREMSAQNEGMPAPDADAPPAEPQPTEPVAKPKATRARKPKKAVEE
ncbi:MAG: hypothetical protein L3K03_05275 [Thermoplasmata archaeon]|nr:hypothetical protein [Thermoplasmata archaeon]